MTQEVTAQFLVRAHSQVAGSIPSRDSLIIDVSLSLTFASSLKSIKHVMQMKMCGEEVEVVQEKDRCIKNQEGSRAKPYRMQNTILPARDL